jgi:transketolase
MVISNTARWNMANWFPHAVARDYAVTPDWDDRWRTGGSVDQIVAESHLDADSQKEAITRFVRDAECRREQLGRMLGMGLPAAGASSRA